MSEQRAAVVGHSAAHPSESSNGSSATSSPGDVSPALSLDRVGVHHRLRRVSVARRARIGCEGNAPRIDARQQGEANELPHDQ